jgi:hypothetical protein
MRQNTDGRVEGSVRMLLQLSVFNALEKNSREWQCYAGEWKAVFFKSSFCLVSGVVS